MDGTGRSLVRDLTCPSQYGVELRFLYCILKRSARFRENPAWLRRTTVSSLLYGHKNTCKKTLNDTHELNLDKPRQNAFEPGFGIVATEEADEVINIQPNGEGCSLLRLRWIVWAADVT